MTHFVRGHHGIFIPQYQDIVLPPMGASVAGYITAELIDARTKKVKRKLYFRNLITNSGLDILGSVTYSGPMGTGTPSAATYCAVGTGNTVPANTDTTLVAEVAGGRSSRGINVSGGSYVAGPPDYHKATATHTFTESQANGNLTEVGFFDASSAGIMFSRQLFKDELGNPTTITKTSSDQLRITYELRMYPPAADVVSNAVDISGSAYDITVRAINVGSATWNGILSQWISSTVKAPRSAYSGALPIRNGGDPSGLLGSSTTPVVVAAYVSGNYYLETTAKWEPTNITSSIPTIVCGSSLRIFGIGFSPALPKTNTKRLTLVDRFSWARHP